MNSASTAGFVLALGFAGFACAEEASIVGRYTGTFDAPGTQRQNVPVGLTLVIDKVVDRKIEATGQIHPLGAAQCVGEFPMAGVVNGKDLRLRNVKPFGRTNECNLVLRLTLDGSRLVGTTAGGRPVQLSR